MVRGTRKEDVHFVVQANRVLSERILASCVKTRVNETAQGVDRSSAHLWVKRHLRRIAAHTQPQCVGFKS
jgi:hypothetical protein